MDPSEQLGAHVLFQNFLNKISTIPPRQRTLHVIIVPAIAALEPYEKSVVELLKKILDRRDASSEDILLIITQGAYGERYSTPVLTHETLDDLPEFNGGSRFTESMVDLYEHLSRRQQDPRETIRIHYIGTPCTEPITPELLARREYWIHWAHEQGWEFVVTPFGAHLQDCAYSIGFPFREYILIPRNPLMSGIPPVLQEADEQSEAG